MRNFSVLMLPSKRVLIALAFLFLFAMPHATMANTCLGASPTWTVASPFAAANFADCAAEPFQCGDTVNVPTSSGAPWTSIHVTFTAPNGCSGTQGLTIKGATVCTPSGTPGSSGYSISCVDNTIIQFNPGSQLQLNGAADGVGVIYATGITAKVNGTFSTTVCPINLSSAPGGVQFRFYLNHLESLVNNTSCVLYTGGSPGSGSGETFYGLIDHNFFDESLGGYFNPPIVPTGDFNSRGLFDWAQPTNLGSNQATYIEANYFPAGTFTSEGLYDGYFGCKVVLRYNFISDTQEGGTHGTDSGNYHSCVLNEIYHNWVTSNTGTPAVIGNSRGGVVITHDNTYAGSLNPPTGWPQFGLSYFRLSEPNDVSFFGAAAAGVNWIGTGDGGPGTGNVANTIVAPAWTANNAYAADSAIQVSGTGNFWVSASCTSGSSTPSWNTTVSSFVPGGAGTGYPAGTPTTSDGTCVWYNVGGITTSALGANCGAGGASQCYGFLSTAPDTPCTTGPNCTRPFDPIGGVYPYRDFCGLIHGQVTYGNYSWNNTRNGVANATMFAPDNAACESGRDYFENTSAPGYTPFTYPHPLDTIGSVVLTPASQFFGNITVGVPSAPFTFTLTNNSSATATSITPTTTSGNPGDFIITNSGTGSCGALSGSLTAGSSCTFTVVFTPAALGARSTTLSVSYSGGDGASPQTSSLSGTAIPSVINPSPANPVMFGVVVTDPSNPSTVKNEKHSENSSAYDFDRVALVGFLRQDRARNAAGGSASQ